MKRSLTSRFCVVGAMALGLGCGGESPPPAGTPGNPTGPTIPLSSVACDAGNGGMTLPAGFCATIFADQVGTARHLAVTATGEVYVMLTGGAVLALRDTNNDGHSDMRATFGRSGNSGLA